MRLVLRCIVGALLGVLISVGYYHAWESTQSLWPWWAGLFVIGVLIAWRQAGYRWVVALVLWIAYFLWVDQAWRSDRNTMRAKDPYCCVLKGLEGLFAVIAMPWTFIGVYLEPAAKRLRSKAAGHSANH